MSRRPKVALESHKFVSIGFQVTEAFTVYQRRIVGSPESTTLEFPSSGSEGSCVLWCRRTQFQPSKKGDNEHYHYARVKLDEMLPSHTRTWKIASNSKTKVGMQAHASKKTEKEEFLDREILKEDDKEIIIRRMPVMVKRKTPIA
ncbi:hypothetical protein CR513_47478, partial [Mucuna pruriens]